MYNDNIIFTCLDGSQHCACHFRYLVTVESDDDVREYLADLLNPSVPRHQRFIDQLMKRWRPPERKVEANIPADVTVST